MSILIDSIRIAGFRGIKNLEVSLPRITVLIGPNNAGKTSLIKALQLSFGDYSRYLTEEDFYIASDENRVSEIIVDVRVVATDADGKRVTHFDNEWQTAFGDKIQSEANGNQFVAIRTRAEQNVIKGGFDTNRTTLEAWPPFETWTTTKVKGTKLGIRFQSLPLISMEAQRDIHQDLRDRSSFIGKILASVEYDKNDILELESLIKQVNDDAVNKSNELQGLKFHLEKLNQSIGGTGGAEITPFPKKIRDLSKNFSIYFGETDTNSFSMEYHGMGTRSWASMLTIQSFVDILSKRHASESEPLFPILTVEEPEAHLHPNAQKTLYRQLSGTNGQLILSTHSPFLAAMADLYEIRSLVKTQNGIAVHQISHQMTKEEKKTIARSVLAKNGELLFAKSLLLFEGVTEGQVLPAMFKIYTGYAPWDIGLSCISVDGKAYRPYLRLGSSFGIPTSILSDNDQDTKTKIGKIVKKLSDETGVSLNESLLNINFFNAGNDFEAELMANGLRNEIINAFVLLATATAKQAGNDQFINSKRTEFNKLNDDELIIKMRNEKASYAGFLADVLLENKENKPVDELVPPNVRTSFDCIKGWLVC